MRRLWIALALCLMAGSWTGAVGQELEPGAVALSKDRLVRGEWARGKKTISIGGLLYGEWGNPANSLHGRFATFDVRDWSLFRTSVGLEDGRKSGVASIEVDNAEVWRRTFGAGERVVPVEVSLSGHQTMTIRGDYGITCVNPRLIKGSAIASRDSASSAPSPPSRSATAPIAVDPTVLKTLAQTLRAQVAEDPQVAARIGSGRVAVSTFALVDIPSSSVAQNVAEDLTTAMINARFRLVERGQLDQVLKELRIQNLGLVDPATAQKIGRLSGCDVILLGSISDRGTFVVINARLMETATGQSLAAAQVEMRKMPISRGGG